MGRGARVAARGGGQEQGGGFSPLNSDSHWESLGYFHPQGQGEGEPLECFHPQGGGGGGGVTRMVMIVPRVIIKIDEIKPRVHN